MEDRVDGAFLAFFGAQLWEHAPITTMMEMAQSKQHVALGEGDDDFNFQGCENWHELNCPR
jgi:hypothetical protein